MEKFASGETVDARVETATRGGLSVLLYGVSGFVPSSHLGSKVAENPQALTGGNVKLKSIEADQEKNRLVLSEKAVSESDQMARQAAVLKEIKKGEEFVGRVSRVVNFGVFVEVEKDGIKMDGLVHLSEISWQKVTSAGEVLKEGESVPVIVIGREEGRLALSIKQRTEDPWTQAIGKYKSDAKVSGKVTKTGEFGAFVELEPGVEGLIHSSKIPADMSVKEGDLVDCFIEEVDGAKHKLSLGLVLKAKPMGYR
jgi:ribosomal protein S1